MTGMPSTIHGDGSNLRSYLYIDDIVDGFEVILHEGNEGDVYNIGTEDERSVIEVARDICEHFSLDPDVAVKFVEDRPFNDKRYFIDVQKLRKFGWHPKTTWKEGLDNTIAWYTINLDWWDWCEFHPMETIRANVIGTLTLADVCREYGILMMNYSSGCIFDYDDAHPLGSGIGFKEEDKSNYSDSFFSKGKAMVEELLRRYENVCSLRMRLPTSSDLGHPRNLINKLTRYEKVVNIPNSMTVLDELLPISIEMTKRNYTGIWNLTNLGTISHNEILEMYKEYVNPNFKWVNFTLEEQAKVLVAPRCNCELDATKLKKEFLKLLPVKRSLDVCL
ncbi:RHAMNOSE BIOSYNTHESIS 2 [Ancistrocladus abbreviatus]